MNNELQVIDERELLGKQFRMYGTIEEPLFLAKDVAEWIEHSNSREMLNTVEDNEKLMSTLFTSGQRREAWFLTEDGLYEVLMQSRLPIAKAFKNEVKEILKTIRKHGAYMTPDTIEKVLLNPDFGIKLLTALKDEQTKRKQLEAEKQIMLPKAEYFDELVDRNLLTSFRETAKELRVKEKDFIAFLMGRYIYRDQKGKLMPYAEKNNGLFEVKERFSQTSDWAGIQTLVTPKGRETFRLLLQETNGRPKKEEANG